MCGIAGIISINNNPIEQLTTSLGVMSRLIAHRGPDGNGIWMHPKGFIGFAHNRLSIIDLSSAAAQPMTDGQGNWIIYNGEIYNYLELREELGKESFRTASDTEVILKAYLKWGEDCVNYLRGMFAFAIWDEKAQTLFCARDRFGIKPFYYLIQDNTLFFASEIKGILPFISSIETDPEGLKQYLAFQFCLSGKTLFKNISELLPGHILSVKNGEIHTRRYWDIFFEPDFNHTSKYHEQKLFSLIDDSLKFHMRSDVPVGAYLSGGLDSSITATLGSDYSDGDFMAFTGKFNFGPEYDESMFARAVAERKGFSLNEINITSDDFIKNIRRVIYHLDYPVAGPGSFPQFMVSELASKKRKVVLGGQGGDEIFGGYTRYLIAYFEQCIKGAIDGTLNSGNFIVTYESIIPNLISLRNYKPLLKDFWREGLFEDMDKRYFRLINRANTISDEIRWELLQDYSPFDEFRKIFNGDNVRKESYFDLMTHFDFKTLLPALLQVEDRMSMAHGLESRVPFLDHPLVEYAATIPADIKFKDGTMKHVLKNAMSSSLPEIIVKRKDKMGFPTPLTEWAKGELKEFIYDILTSEKALKRDFIDNRKVFENLEKEPQFGRKLWGFLSLELWQQEFHDQAYKYKKMLSD